MEIVLKKLNEITPYENNPRNNERAIEKVAKSIKEFGFKVPLVITSDGIIVTGHTRYKASQELGLQEVPCIIADDLTEEQINAFRLADNKVSEFSEWDFSKLEEELDKLELDMEDFGFTYTDIEWDNVEDLTEETYEEPTHKMLECPKCHHIDRDIHFKKVEATDSEIKEDGVEVEINENTNE